MSKSTMGNGRDTIRFSNPENEKNPVGIRHLVGKGSHRGQKRDENEDSIVAFEYHQILNSISYPIGIYLVADGLGGYSGGEIASSLAVKGITEEIVHGLFSNHTEATPQASYRSLFENAVFKTNEKIYQQALAMKNEMGATLTGAFVAGRTASVINIGDSRAYLFNKEDGLQLISQDHTLVFRFYLMGDLKFEEIYNHPQRNQILRSLGEAGLKENLQEMMDQANHPYFFQLTLDKGDTLLLCSDGLWQEVRDPEIEKNLLTIPDPQKACDFLINLANTRGGHDNISLIIVKIE